MSVPKASIGEEFAYEYQYAVILKLAETMKIFLDRYLYEPVHPPLFTDGGIWLSGEDLRRIYSPYLTVRGEILSYHRPPEKAVKAEIRSEEIREERGIVYIKLTALKRILGKEFDENPERAILAIDGKEPVSAVYPGPMSVLPYINRMKGKEKGMQDYSVWMEKAARLIPYRMYIPSGYIPGVPNKTVVCFHGGDANQDYMFLHTNNEICRYAENEGYILLALCSYRKYTFFGASRIPSNAFPANPKDPNPCGLSEEEMICSQNAEESVLLQIRDAGKRYSLDPENMYALGNSGGSLGIFRQVGILPKGFFRAVSCSGGMPHADFLDLECLRKTGTRFLLLMGSEDFYDNEYTSKEGYPKMKNAGIPVIYHTVGGGMHLTGWADGLDKSFLFFRENR